MLFRSNSREYLDSLVEQVQDLLKLTAHAPSVQMFDAPTDKTTGLKFNKIEQKDEEM